jgi:hypothetical protein
MALLDDPSDHHEDCDRDRTIAPSNLAHAIAEDAFQLDAAIVVLDGDLVLIKPTSLPVGENALD